MKDHIPVLVLAVSFILKFASKIKRTIKKFNLREAKGQLNLLQMHLTIQKYQGI